MPIELARMVSERYILIFHLIAYPPGNVSFYQLTKKKKIIALEGVEPCLISITGILTAGIHQQAPFGGLLWLCFYILVFHKPRFFAFSISNITFFYQKGKACSSNNEQLQLNYWRHQQQIILAHFADIFLC